MGWDYATRTPRRVVRHLVDTRVGDVVKIAEVGAEGSVTGAM